MDVRLKEQVAFYLTGRGPGTGLDPIEEFDLRPALLAGYRDITHLRYDFPLVLVNDTPPDRRCVQSLSAIVDGVLQEITHDDDRDRLTQHLLRLEQHVRAAVAAGANGLLSALWDVVADELMAPGDESLIESLQRAREALTDDGEVVDCGEATPRQLMRHAWLTVQRAKADHFRNDIGRLIRKLSDILSVDDAHSEAGLSAGNLKAAVGKADAEMFDFEVMSLLLGKSSASRLLPPSRRERIEQLLSVLTSQRFFGDPRGTTATTSGVQPYSFEFEDLAGALEAYRERMPQAVELAKAMAVAELEIDSHYNEETHDALFSEFGGDGLDALEMARFPDYLVFTDAAHLHGSEFDTLTEILAAGLPMKVLVQTDDIVEQSVIGGESHLSIGLRSRQFASMIMGFNHVFLLQASGSHLYRFREHILKGLANTGSAVFSVFSGASVNSGGLPAYIVAAMAMESRAFPAFTYDPAAGDNWAARFSLDSNAQPDSDWPIQRFAFADERYQRVETLIPFTLVDLAACDRRLQKHFARVPRASWNGSFVPIDDWLSADLIGGADKTPSIFMVDDKNRLQKVIVDEKLIDATKRCRDAWHSLQELGGIHNSHAERLLARERLAWEERLQQVVRDATPLTESAPASIAVAVETSPPTVDGEPTEPEPLPSSDDAYVETARCTTCNECIQINNKMFAYDDNKQCRIADLDAGTYRELVEAAENCQVAIIHPGKPRNPNEPGLEDLIKRAEAFR